MSTPVLLPSTTETADKVSCRLCRRQFAKYTCPTCNVPYCSLICFRSEAHSQCSETFYKKEVESDIRTEPSKTPQERLHMLELLKKFEEENNNPAQLTVDGDDEDEDEDEGDTEDAAADLAQRFQSVDINMSSSNTLWSILTEEERKKFMKAIDDPNSELAQQILASEDLEKEIQSPWWEASGIEDDETNSLPSRSPRQYGHRPDMMRIPTSMVKAAPIGPPLVYNMCAICIAYAYSIRHLGTSTLSMLHPDNPDYHEGRKLVSKLVPFITDRRSTVLFPNLSSVVTDIWSRFDLGQLSSGLFALLLSDTAQLMRTLPVVPLPPQVCGLTGADEPGKSDMDLSLNPHTLSVLILSDLSHFFGTLSIERGWRKPNHVTHKILFYAAHILSTPTAVLNAVAAEVELRAKSFQNDEKK